jgi:transcriptional regulator with XRE-family HTH domain
MSCKGGDHVIGMRLKERRTFLGITQEALAKKIDRKKLTVSRWERGERAPNAEDMPVIAQSLDTTVAYLMGETDNPAPLLKEVNLRDQGEIKSNVATINDALMIPVVSDDVSACCGRGSIYAEDVKWEIIGYYPVDPNDLIGYTWQTDKFRIIRAEGDSMEPRIYDGDRIIFADELKVESGDFAVVLWDGWTLARVILFNPDNTITLRSMKEDEYKDILVEPGDDRFCVLGKLLGIAPAIRKIGTYY